MKTKIIYPRHPVLKEFIQYFLFIEKEDFKEVSQICYPNTNHCLSLMQDSYLFKQNDFNYSVLPSNTNSSYLTGIYKNPINISANFPYKELCINFNPLGLEAILNEKLSSFIFKNNVLNYYEEANWSHLFEIVFSKNSLQSIHCEIEAFFISNIKENFMSYQNFDLNKIESSVNVNEVSELINKSYRSTHRFFKSELGLTPKEFLIIKKVREGMQSIFDNKSITEIAYDLDFTDQSHFIKTFKKYTNLSPLQFRKSVLKVDNTLIWNIE
ncbi:helix-turn-helix domain-containing protein [Aquimarina aquimarini]|uniref:helix-turn-helix domain-containing protein n=1 Tax=Aquimarina aquimarini TaxID=1191734 RepID=UPI000D553002|nr:helix-turn-helix transcriptional regulator [Aquimarina aquimarini]